MQVKVTDLSKKSLETIVEAAIEKGIFKEDLLQIAYRSQLANDLCKIRKSYKELTAKMKQAKSRYGKSRLATQIEAVARRGNKKLEIYKSLPKEDSGKDAKQS